MDFKVKSFIFFLLNGVMVSVLVIYVASFCSEETLVCIGAISFLIGVTGIIWMLTNPPEKRRVTNLNFLGTVAHFLPYWLLMLGVCIAYYVEIRAY